MGHQRRLARATRRGVLRTSAGTGGAAALGGLLQAACAPGAENPSPQQRDTTPVKVSYLRYYDQPSRVAAERTIFQRLQEERPGLTIEELHSADVGPAMVTNYAAGTAPDVWTTAPTIYHEYVRAGNLLQLDDRIKKDIDPKKYFTETQFGWESPATSGKHYGLTRNFVVTLLYYNKNMFDAARVPYPDATWSFDTVLQHAPKFVKNPDSAETSEWAFIAAAAHGNFDPMARANGGMILNRQKTRSVMEGNAQTAATLEQWVAISQQQRLSPPPAHPFHQSFQGLTLRHPFFTGRLAMFLSLTGLATQLKDAGNSLLQWNVAMAPKGKVKRDTYGGQDGLVLSKETKQADLAWRLALSFLKPDALPFHLAWGGLPFSREITALPAWRDQEPKGHTQLIVDSVPHAMAEFNLDYNKWQTAKNTAVTDALNGKIGVRDAIRVAHEEVNKVLTAVYPQA